MNKYVPRELHNLKDSKKRVIESVEVAIRKKRTVSYTKWMATIASVAAIFFIGLFTYEQMVLKEKQQPAENPIPIILEEGQYDEMLRAYFAEDQSKKLMYDSSNGFFSIETTWLSKQYVKEVTKYESHSLVHYYRIANNKIEIVKRENGEGNYSIEELNTMEADSVLVEAPFHVGQSNGDWMVKKANSRWGMFNDVVVLEHNVNGYITTLTLAPEFGQVHIVGSKDGKVEIESTFMQLISAHAGGEVHFNKFSDSAVELPKDKSWLTSPSGKYRMILQGIEEFESVGTIYIEEMANNYQTAFTIAYENYYQMTPKDVAWIDDHRIFVIIGMTHGTVTMGGNLYILDLENNSLNRLFDNLPVRSEISGISSIDGENFHYEQFTYLTDMMEQSESEVAEGIITIEVGKVDSLNGDEITYSRNNHLGKTVKVVPQRNKDIRAMDLKDVQVGDNIEFIMLDGVAVHLNKVE